MSDTLPVLLVPGLNCSARLYAPQIPALWARGPVMIADHRRDVSMTAIARRLLIEAPPRFHLVGLSMGGHISFELLRQAPERIASVALLDTSARADVPAQTERRHAQIALATSGRFAEVPEVQWPMLVDESRHGDAGLKQIIVAMAEETGPDAFVRQQTAIMGRIDSRPHLVAVTCPALVIVGGNDRLTPPDHAQEIAAGIRGSRLVTIPGAGHLTTLETPDAVTGALVDFLT
jgi:pimeloyl-ACP methyl ester carboxylesterase